MAISIYIGTNGSGKTYEVVKNVLIPALKIGRAVVTNVPLNLEWLSAELKIDSALVTGFNSLDEFLDLIKEENVIAGALYCVDESWEFFTPETIKERVVVDFLSMHRHYTSSSGVSTDIVVINQGLSSLPRFLRERAQSTFKMKKQVALGLNSRYSVSVFEGAKTTKASLVSQFQQKYDKTFFKAYNSFSRKTDDLQDPRIIETDSRVNFFRSPKFFLTVLLPIPVLFFSLSYLVSLGEPKNQEGVKKEVKVNIKGCEFLEINKFNVRLIDGTTVSHIDYLDKCKNYEKLPFFLK